ncbi:hypothetical protein Taro_009926 [Colocasia esculenta]|uniref:Microtubule-binding protein TANGLED1 n=1 Tax=Colocasia esculenta TaxID=4460 RepID=A0A843U1N0_COLES|nr:hypothetical protein [Colocasia esculenta]
MVAKTPPGKEKRMAAALNAAMVREAVKKVDKCVARLQELQYAVSGGSKTVAGVRLSPRSTRGYLRTSVRCKQETLRMKNATGRRSPVGKFPEKASGDWRRMSLPAMLLGETIAEILQTSQMAKQVVAAATRPTPNIPNARAAAAISASADPKTPVALRRRNPATSKVACEITELKARRTKEKQALHRPTRSESGSPPLRRARSRISFKAASPPSRREGAGGATHRHIVAAQRVSPKNRPWAKKTVLFPNPIFSSPSSRQQKFCKTGSPVIARGRQTTTTTPHKFLIKSPPSASKFQIRVKGAPAVSPTRLPGSRPKMAAVAKLRRSFSPARIASRLVSPLKSRSSCRREPHDHGRRSSAV